MRKFKIDFSGWLYIEAKDKEQARELFQGISLNQVEDVEIERCWEVAQ